MLTSSYTMYPGVESTTRRTALERFFRESGFGEYGTATGGTTTTLIDTTALQSSQYSADVRPGAWLRISYDAGGAAAAPEGEIRPITTYDPATGTINVSPAFSAAPASGDKYQIWRYIHPQRVLDLLDDIMREDVFLPEWALLTEIPDGDMEDTGVTNWTATAMTLTKRDNDTSGEWPMGWGRSHLRAVATNATNSVISDTMLVVPGRSYYFGALVGQATSNAGTISVIGRDVTNATDVTTVTTTNLQGTRLYGTFTAPATCKSAAIKISHNTNSSTTYIDDVIWFEVGTKSFSLPSWVKNLAQVKGIFKTYWTGSNEAGGLDPLPMFSNDAGNWDFMDAGFGRNRLSIVSGGGSSYPILIYGARNETAWANENTDTKHVDQRWLIACLCYRIFGQMTNQPNSGNLNSDWIVKQYGRWDKIYKEEMRKQEVRLEYALQAEEGIGYFYPDRFAGYSSWPGRAI